MPTTSSVEGDVIPNSVMTKHAQADGHNVLYHYLQHSLQTEDVWLYQMLVSKLVVALGIWFPVEAYRRMPIALPYVIRDPKCRQPVDQWSSPTPKGFLRDDNTLVKNLVKTLSVDKEGFRDYRGRRLGRGFVAAHVWRQTKGEALASRIATTNTFLPNLVWLPNNVAKLTDREGSFAQTFVQAIASKVYRKVEVADALQPYTDEAWDLLPEPAPFPEQALPDTDDLTFFDVPDSFIERTIHRSQTVARALEAVAAGTAIDKKVLHTRYTEGLPSIAAPDARALSNWLKGYSDAVMDGL